MIVFNGSVQKPYCNLRYRWPLQIATVVHNVRLEHFWSIYSLQGEVLTPKLAAVQWLV